MALKSRYSTKLLKAYQEICKYYESRGFKLILYRMDNEMNSEVKEFIQEQHTGLQYIAPERHCVTAKKVVQTYKFCLESTPASLPA